MAPPPSNEASMVSRACLLGFPEREYSKPYVLRRERDFGITRSTTYLVLPDPVLLESRTEGYRGDDCTRLRIRF